MPTDTTDLSTVYTTLEENDVYAHDQVIVDQAGGNGAYLMHMFKKTHENREDNIEVRVVAKSSYAPTSGAVYLQIWNGTTLSWETIASVNDKNADTDFSLDASIPTNDSNYYDFGNQIAVRVYQLNNSGVAKTFSIDQVIISFVAQYQEMYSAQANQYTEVHPEVTSEYTPKYPSPNPQDDL